MAVTVTAVVPRFGCVDECAPIKPRTPGAIEHSSSESSTTMGPAGTPSTDTSLSEAASSQDSTLSEEAGHAPELEEAGKAKRRRRPRRRGGSGRVSASADSMSFGMESAGAEDPFCLDGHMACHAQVPPPCRPVGAVVTLDDLGIKLGLSGVPTTGDAFAPPACAVATACAAPPPKLAQRPPPAPLAEAVWPQSPCKARAGPRGDLMSTSPVAPGPCTSVLAAAGEASERQPATPLAPLSTPPPRPMLSTAAGPAAPAAPTGDASARTRLGTSPVHEATWVGPSSPACGRGIMSTAPPQGGSAPGSAPGSDAAALSPAGSPTADALRSLFHASGLSSMAEAHKRLMTMAPETYED